MSSKAKLFAASIAFGALITVVSLFGVDLAGHPHIDRLSRAVHWPVALCEKLAGPGPRFTRGGHEGTPVQLLAAVVGVGLTWAIYSSIFFLAVRFVLRKKASQDH